MCKVKFVCALNTSPLPFPPPNLVSTSVLSRNNKQTRGKGQCGFQTKRNPFWNDPQKKKSFFSHSPSKKSKYIKKSFSIQNHTYACHHLHTVKKSRGGGVFF